MDDDTTRVSSPTGPYFRELSNSSSMVDASLRNTPGNVYDQESQPLKAQFDQLVNKWESETINLSSIDRMIRHPAYLRIIGMGKPILPLLLSELRKKPNHWFVALVAITDVDPVADEDRGNLSKMAESWIEWGEQEQYC